MGKLVVNQNLVTKENAPEIQSLCPFGAITYENDKLDISLNVVLIPSSF